MMVFRFVLIIIIRISSSSSPFSSDPSLAHTHTQHKSIFITIKFVRGQIKRWHNEAIKIFTFYLFVCWLVFFSQQTHAHSRKTRSCSHTHTHMPSINKNILVRKSKLINKQKNSLISFERFLSFLFLVLLSLILRLTVCLTWIKCVC